jgi:hypothetical protein
VDEIPVTVIKSVNEYKAPTLSLLINHSIVSGVFPDALKIAKIKSLFKSGDQTVMSNYRPISILNSFSKIYEKVIYNRIEFYSKI